MTRKRKISAAILAVIIILAAGGIWWFRNLTGKVFVRTPPEDGPKYDNTIAEKLDLKKPINVLLLGYGGGDHDGTYLTDTIMVASIDPVLAKTTLISIPRDIWVGEKKINSYYSLAIKEGAATAGRAAMDAVSQVTGVNIDRFISVSFAGFTRTIDTLGGVDVKVDITFDDFQYPVEGKEEDLCGHDPAELPEITATAAATKNPELIFPCRYKQLHFDAGVTHMNGETALEYVRSRHSAQDGNDFGRARRQRNLIVAVKQKILSINFLGSVIPFVNSLGGDVRTDFSLDEARLLLAQAGAISKYTIANLAITDENYLVNSQSREGQFILIPKAGKDNWLEVQTWIATQLATKPVPDSLAVMVENGTSTPKLAQQAAEKIKGLGLKVVGTRNASVTNVTQTKITIFDTNIKSEELNKLKTLFGVDQTNESETAATGNYNVVVTVGNEN